jgi:hypothetical protein
VKSLIRWLRARGSCQQNQLPETSSGQTRGEMRTQGKVKENRCAGYLDGDEAMPPLRQARGRGRRLDEKGAKSPPPHRLELPAFPSLVSSPRSMERAARRSLLGGRCSPAGGSSFLVSSPILSLLARCWLLLSCLVTYSFFSLSFSQASDGSITWRPICQKEQC